MTIMLTSSADNCNQKIRVATRIKKIDVRAVTIGRRIKVAREAAGLSQEALAKAIGASQSAVANWETGINPPRRSLIQKIASTLKLTPEFLEFGDAPARNAQPLLSSTQPRGIELGPIHASAVGGGGEQFIVFGDVIEYRQKPQRWANVKGLYGFYVVGDSMEPRINAGELVWVHPHRSPAIGQEAVFIQKTQEGDEPSILVKVFGGVAGKDWVARQYKPERTFKLPKAEWDVQLIVDIDLNR